MFFETNQVKDILLCQRCEGRQEGPKILPCGETICSFCVTSIQISDNKFDCLVCKEKHEMPKNVFVVNRIASKILAIELTEVSRSEAFNSLNNH